MPATESNPTLTYTRRTWTRAERAMLCSPFKPPLFEQMRTVGVPLNAIALLSGIQHNYTRRSLSELAAENDLTWLIQVGVLRREVDGQGITDSFRLTPLGKQLIEHQGSSWHQPSWLVRVQNTWSRWFRLPI